MCYKKGMVMSNLSTLVWWRTHEWFCLVLFLMVAGRDINWYSYLVDMVDLR